MSKQPSNIQTLSFVIILCTCCAFVLATLSSVLKPIQEKSEILDRSKQMLMSAKLFHHKGYFLLKEGNDFVPAKYDKDSNKLIKGSTNNIATADEIFNVYNQRIFPFLINEQGATSSFKEQNLEISSYLSNNKKTGYANLEWKLAYKVVPNGASKNDKGESFVIPVSGFGLWDAIYGYITIANDGNTVVGISWYDHKETPGLGANIAEDKWQKFFPGKQIFMPSPSGKANLKQAPMGIVVVRGKVTELLGSSAKSISAVDGMAGATLTGNGVSKAYKETLTPYRQFMINLNKQVSL